MRCPGCGYESFDLLETCKRCGAPMVASGTYGAEAVVQAREREASDDGLPDDLRFLRLETADPSANGPGGSLRGAGEQALLPPPDGELEEANSRRTGVSAVSDGGPEFRIDEELFPENAAAVEAWPAWSPPSPPTAGGEPWPEPPLSDPDGPRLLLGDEESGGDRGPIIDRDEEVPERFWAPEVAGLGRRGLALFIDQALLGLLLGAFFLGACAALRLSGLGTDALFAAAGLRAALPPFALLAALLSLVYHVFFHGRDGRTPGKALTGVAVRTRDGSVPSLAQSALRWFASALGVSCAGAGIVWAFFHPRRCGWADLLSATLVAERRRPAPEAPPWR